MSDDEAAVVLAAIVECRRRFYACTGRLLERETGAGHSTTQRRLERLYADGMVDWTEVPGSIVVTGLGWAELRRYRAAA